MSALNVAITGDGQVAYILTDTAAYETLQRVILGFAAKVRTYPHAQAAVAIRGNVSASARMFLALQLCADFDEMADKFERAFVPGPGAKFFQLVSKLVQPVSALAARRLRERTHIEFCVVGWSRSECKMKAITGGNAGDTRYLLRTFETGLIAPELSEQQKASIQWPTISQAKRDPLAWPDALMAAIHYQRENRNSAASYEFVGGGAVLTTITPQQITQRVVHCWDDKKGQRIC